MDRGKLKQQLITLFPHLKEKEAEFLVTTGDSLNVMITRILDNNIEPPAFYLNEIVRTNYPQSKITRNYNYPEVFENPCRINMHQDIQGLRAQASQLNQEAYEYTKQAIGHQIKETRSHFSIKADNKREQCTQTNREAAVIMMRKIVENPGPIDLHGFTVVEAISFMNDLLFYRKFTEVEVITGQKYNSAKIRPAMQEWFKKNNFLCTEDGPCLKAKKKAVLLLEKDMKPYKKWF